MLKLSNYFTSGCHRISYTSLSQNVIVNSQVEGVCATHYGVGSLASLVVIIIFLRLSQSTAFTELLRMAHIWSISSKVPAMAWLICKPQNSIYVDFLRSKILMDPLCCWVDPASPISVVKLMDEMSIKSRAALVTRRLWCGDIWESLPFAQSQNPIL